ncbi:hypothetical protein [Brevibacterium siliguriense]|uniref:hypothetical protein n=1 Tax=Brevibacterium siliguriense TaxID=1136497 RepID=UPI000B86B743|nr:hypothetical protein [Brevibacterium siliguriense]
MSAGERIGRVSVDRLSEHILSDFGDIVGDHVFPDYEGHFHAIMYSVSEAERGLRDRLQCIVRSRRIQAAPTGNPQRLRGPKHPAHCAAARDPGSQLVRGTR